MWKAPQVTQTIHSTGSVGAFFGAVPTLALQYLFVGLVHR